MACSGGGILTREIADFGLKASTITTFSEQIPYRLTSYRTRALVVRPRSLPYSMSSTDSWYSDLRKEDLKRNIYTCNVKIYLNQKCLRINLISNYKEISYLKAVSIVYWNIRELRPEDGLKRIVETCSYYHLNITFRYTQCGPKVLGLIF
jgi:hypothetical protein